MPPIPEPEQAPPAPTAPPVAAIELELVPFDEIPLDEIPERSAGQDYGTVIAIRDGYAILKSLGKLYKLSCDQLDPESPIEVNENVVVEIKFHADRRWTCRPARQRGTRDRSR